MHTYIYKYRLTLFILTLTLACLPRRPVGRVGRKEECMFIFRSEPREESTQSRLQTYGSKPIKREQLDHELALSPPFPHCSQLAM